MGAGGLGVNFFGGLGLFFWAGAGVSPLLPNKCFDFAAFVVQYWRENWFARCRWLARVSGWLVGERLAAVGS